MLIRPVEGARQVVTQFGGFFHSSCLHRIRLGVAPDLIDGLADFLLETHNQFPVGVDDGLFGFEFGDDGSLDFKRWNRGPQFLQFAKVPFISFLTDWVAQFSVSNT